MLNIKDFKGAIIQYACEDCLISDNFNIIFSKIQKVEQGNCEHFDINMLLINENKEIKYSLSFRCKECRENKIIELFNTKTDDISGSISFSCPNCKKGNITVGFLLENDLIDLDDNINIKLVFYVNNKNYEIYVNPDIYLPEAFSELIRQNNNPELENLDIRCYIKDGQELDKYKSIKELNLNDGNIINIELRENCGYDSNQNKF